MWKEICAISGTTWSAAKCLITEMERLLSTIRISRRCGRGKLKGVLLRHNAQPGTLELREGTYFIFGGDLFDKGPGDIRLSKELVALKQRYPNRVYLLIGNRDANKLRFAAELSDAQLQQVPLDKMTAPFWLTKNRTPTEWLRRKKENKNKKKGEELFDAKEWRALDTRKTRLLWMLEDTLGRGEAVEDGEVVSSFLEGLRPGGCYFEYLKHADIAVRLGNTLFVHGSVSPQSIDFVPSLRLPFAKNAALLPNTGHYVNQEGGGSNDSRSEPADRWIDALNRWGKQAFEEFAKSEAASLDAPLFSGESVESLGSSRPGQSLLCYQCAPGSVRRNVVVESYISRAIPREIPQSVAEYLLDSGISRVVAGHKPVGDCPMVMHTAVCSDGSPFPKYLETVFADTSYSDSKAEDSRGVAVSEVIVEGLSPDANRVRVHGLLRDGSTTIEYALRPLSRGGVDASPPLVPEHFVAEDDRLIGKRLADNFFVRARVSPGVARKAGVSEHAAQPKEHVPSTSSSCEKCHYFLEKTDVKTRRVTTRQASKTEVLCEINQQW
eukprot:jgi/Bigna1/70957/fgenesh1_pg.14_\